MVGSGNYYRFAVNRLEVANWGIVNLEFLQEIRGSSNLVKRHWQVSAIHSQVWLCLQAPGFLVFAEGEC